jgi:SseB protein N-terminal domain
VHGKTIPNPGFSDDDGSAESAVADALTAFREGGIGRPQLVASLAASRLMVPVAAALLPDESAAWTPAEPAERSPALRGEKGAEVALILIKASDGRTALPAFTSLAALHRWNPEARPVPATAQRVCAGALAEGADLVVIDPSGPVTVELAGSVLWALAEGRPLLPPADDPEVVDVVRRASAGVRQAFEDVHVHPSQRQDTDVVISLVAREGSSPDELRHAAEQIASVLAADPIMRSRVDRGVQIAVVRPPSGMPR